MSPLCHKKPWNAIDGLAVHNEHHTKYHVPSELTYCDQLVTLDNAGE